MNELEQQRAVTRVALEAIGESGFALAGSSAIREHGLINRPTRDVDLFTSNRDPDAFTAAVDSVEAAWREAGWDVVVRSRHQEHVQLLVNVHEGRAIEVDLGVDWRANEPTVLEVGPVLELEDAIGNKISALYSRTAPRDFLDVDAIRNSGRFSDEALLKLSEDRDPGFERKLFAHQLQQVERMDPGVVAPYGVSPQRWGTVQERSMQWSREILEPLTARRAAQGPSRVRPTPGAPGADEISGMPPGMWGPSM